MSKFYIEIDSLILIFTFFIIYFNQLGKTTLRKFKKPLFYVSNCSSNFKYLKGLKDGDLFSFSCKDEIICLDKASDFPDFLLSDDFYQINYLKYLINKKCHQEIKMVNLQEKKKILI